MQNNVVPIINSRILSPIRKLTLFPIPTIQKPFLKWAGGKTQMISDLLKFAPETFNKYIEPFIGGGALYFNLNHQASIISDLNEELVITYRQVKDNVQGLIDILVTYKNTEEFFYKIRSTSTNALSHSERAARLIYLNKTCFNGLFRVNKKGEFNVPYGKRNGPFLNKENLIGASDYLKETEIYHLDYKETLKRHAKKGDFIFLDPPYQPVGKFSDFKRYTKEFFYENDQIELASIFKDLTNKGCYVMLTNSDHPFILDKEALKFLLSRTSLLLLSSRCVALLYVVNFTEQELNNSSKINYPSLEVDDDTINTANFNFHLCLN